MDQEAGRRQYRIAPSVLVLVGVTALVSFGISLLDLDDPWAHASIHAVGAGAPAALLLVALRFWPQPFDHRINRRVRWLLVIGLAVLALGQALEMVGAFGYDGNERISALASVHDGAIVVGTVGLLSTMVGVLLSFVVGAAARLDLLDSRWFRVALSAAVAVVALFLVGGLVFGY